MFPRIYDNTFTEYDSNGLGVLRDTVECYVEEESNGSFELFIRYPADSPLCEYIQRENIIKADASKTLKGQLFRIYHVTKPLDGIISAYARHITFDLANDTLNSDISLQNVSCENAGNNMLLQGDHSSKFKIYSNIDMLGDYSMDRKTDCLSAIAGTRGSLIDAFGNGPKILRDNFDIHILKRRGSDNNTLIAYGKNLTGFELQEDDSDLITRIKPYATYTVNEVQEEEGSGGGIAATGSNSTSKTVYLDEIYVDSERIDQYAVIRSTWMDFSNKFDQDETPTKEKLKQLAKDYFINNKCDLPKMTYKIEFEILSQTEEYKDYEILEDIGMDDGVYIANSKYGIRDQAKVVKTKYNPIAEKYISIELGDPRTTLGNVLNNESSSPITRDEVQDLIDENKDKIDVEYPNDLPSAPVLSIDRAGFKSISLSWTYENQPHYTYQVYASQEKGFSPSDYDLIFEGMASSFLHEVDCCQTWYYKARAINTYNSATAFSAEVSATTTKISDAAEYFEEAAIGKALIGNLDADKITAGKLKGTYIDARNLTVTDGNGRTTFYVSSAGEVSLNVKELTIQSINNSNLATSDEVSEVRQTADKISWLVKSGSSASNMQLTDEFWSMITGEVVITADKISLHGYTTVNGGFAIDTSGNMSCKNGTFSGTISGSTITGSTLQTASMDSKYIKMSDCDYKVWNNNKLVMSMGLKDLAYINGTVTNDTPCVWLGADGFNFDGGTSFTGKTGRYFGRIEAFNHLNPIASNYTGYYQVPYLNIRYNTKYETINGNPATTNFRLFGNGDIMAVPVKNFIVKSRFKDGSFYDGVQEFEIAKFYSSSSEWYDSAMEIEGIINTHNPKGVFITDLYYGSGGDVGNINGSPVMAGFMAKCGAYTDGTVMRSFRPHQDGTAILGSSSYRWKYLWCTSTTIQTSDRRAKENIEYLSNVSNSNVKISMQYSPEDIYNYIKEIPYATYNLKNDDEEKNLGFILQDLVEINPDLTNDLMLINVKYEEEEDNSKVPLMGYSQANYVNFLGVALQQAMKKIEALEEKIKKLEV